ncbi:MAG: hypothetical protein BWY70_01704 [Bacteroidetes bacterium ADurb.Bin408]|nr:MAG: hypothetical protein BWY70_01704 [Bacteroidetes bacterium ADurb.Bin408]
MKTLIYGYGNPGRKDDGLGARFIELVDNWIANEEIQNIKTDCNYQLNIEDAAVVAEYDRVIFVDASVAEDVIDFKLENITPNDASIEFTMHAVSTAFVIELCQKIYNKLPDAYNLHIKAYDFDFIEELSPIAESNLYAAFGFLKNYLTSEQ